MGNVHISATEVIKSILKDKLVEIADALNMRLFLKNIPDRKEYIIDYLLDQKGRPKR